VVCVANTQEEVWNKNLSKQKPNQKKTTYKTQEHTMDQNEIARMLRA